MKNLAHVSQSEQEEFFNSFDQIFSDVDGVIWFMLGPIPGTDLAVRSLQNIGKRVRFVSNNSFRSYNGYHEEFISKGFALRKGELVTPMLAIATYLKKINFTKEVMVVGNSPMKEDLKRFGIKIADESGMPALFAGLTLQEALPYIKDDEKVGAVILDIDFNLDFKKMQKVVSILGRSDVIFMKGAMDALAPIGPNTILIGPKYFQDAIEEVVGRKAMPFGKPSPQLKEYVNETFEVKDPSRVLFVGDSIPQDMGFAASCGYRKLLVLTGISKLETLEGNWKWPENYKPDYYVDSLKALHDIIESNANIK